MMENGWIGVDLDGTLAEYDGEHQPTSIGAPIWPMIHRVQAWIAEGRDVRIFTARVDGGLAALALGNPAGARYMDKKPIVAAIEDWCLRYLGVKLPVTNVKDYGMVELWDDRAVGIVPNVGIPVVVDALAKFRGQIEIANSSIRALEEELGGQQFERFRSVQGAIATLVKFFPPDNH